MNATDAVVQRGIDYEVSLADLVRRSERRAWRVATVAALVAASLGIALVALLPLKQTLPFLVLADPASGVASVARLEPDALDRTLAASEALNRAHVAQFVRLREGYDHGAIRLREWRIVHSMAAPEVATAYKALYDAGNPANPDRIHGRARAIRVDILSIVLLGGAAGRPPSGATVRFRRSLFDKRTASTAPLDSRIATLEFAFNPRLRMDEADRLNNPLGFQVTGYRTDEDFAAPPTPAGDAGALPADPPPAGEAMPMGAPDA